MRTPSVWIKNLDKQIITEDMLEAALISVNKRAKNYRNRKREYRQKYRYAYRDYGATAEKQQDLMYLYKEKLLSICTPVCLHQEFAGYPRVRYYDYEPDFAENMFQAFKRNKIVWINSYYGNDDFDINEQDIGKEVWFFDIIDEEHPESRWYLYYIVGSSTFHHPISEDNVNSWIEKGLKVVKIPTLTTDGENINDLISLQFVKKLLTVIDSSNYILKVNLFHLTPSFTTGWPLPDKVDAVKISVSNMLGFAAPGLIKKIRQSLIDDIKTSVKPLPLSKEERQHVISRITQRKIQNDIRLRKGKKAKPFKISSLVSFLKKNQIQFRVHEDKMLKDIKTLEHFDFDVISTLLLKNSNVKEFCKDQRIIQGKIAFVEQNLDTLTLEAETDKR